MCIRSWSNSNSSLSTSWERGLNFPGIIVFSFFVAQTNYLIASLLAGAEALYQRRGIAAQVKRSSVQFLFFSLILKNTLPSRRQTAFCSIDRNIGRTIFSENAMLFILKCILIKSNKSSLGTGYADVALFVSSPIKISPLLKSFIWSRPCFYISWEVCSPSTCNPFPCSFVGYGASDDPDSGAIWHQ